MASPIRSHMHGEKRGEYNNVHPLDPHQPILAVEPLNSVPYVDPQMFSGDIPSSTTEIGTEPMVTDAPALLFLPSCPNKKDWNNIMTATKNGIGLTGSAAMGKVGPIIGSVDVAESEDAYLFRVSLPGVEKENKFKCEVDPNGKVVVEGISSTGERIVRRGSQIFEMLTQNLCPPGYFSVSFQLPGPVDIQQFKGIFGLDGILEGVVKRRPSRSH
ncbi:alpha-crystallin domain-containing protein 22.3 [Cornus florida]|uniref:alpha-crystallin domain-containing protein 22.3 n=1 Tax=Cornus florida TaxID=4283 RepID=UPI00289A5FE9|nr:alpha-crystallin domain-containing protein 22.3 [Cornus florida]